MLRTFTACVLLLATAAHAEWVNFDKKEIHLRIAYVSTSREAATDNLDYVATKSGLKREGDELVFAPEKLGKIRDFSILLHLVVTTAGTKLERTDAIVFIADAAKPKDNAELMKKLGTVELPVTLQVVGEGESADDIAKQLGLLEAPRYAASPKVGVGVFDTVKSATKQSLQALKKK